MSSESSSAVSDRPPSDAAWRAIEGGYDLHVHVAPDIIVRRTDDVSLAEEFVARKLKGFALKSHYAPTAERAKVVTRAVPGIAVVGTLTLNHAIGGFNPVAVEVAGRSGARIVWMPTVDALNEVGGHASGGKVPAWLAIQRELERRQLAPPPLTVTGADGGLTPAVRQCLEVIAEHDMALATGHLHRDEVFALVAGARALGVRRIVVTHPEFPTQRISGDDQARLAAMGALIEHCFTTPHTGKCSWGLVFDGIRRTGAASCLISTDLGQPSNPAVSDGFAQFAQRLLDAGFTADDVRQMAVINPTRLVEADVTPFSNR